jgi:hypothetical protein
MIESTHVADMHFRTYENTPLAQYIIVILGVETWSGLVAQAVAS